MQADSPGWSCAQDVTGAYRDSSRLHHAGGGGGTNEAWARGHSRAVHSHTFRIPFGRQHLAEETLREPPSPAMCYVLPRAPAGVLVPFGLLGLRTPGGSDAYCVMRIGRGMTNTQYAEALDPLIAEIVVVMGCFHHQAMYVVTPRMRGQGVEWCGGNKFG